MLTHLVCFAALADTEPERIMEQRVQALERRLEALEAKLAAAAQPSTADERLAQALVPAQEPQGSDWPRDITVSAHFDGNYTWNLARPYNRINLLRAYDVLHNNFNISQTGLVIERAVDADSGRRFGLRLDLMYGQATETIQGGAQNELRPQVFRPVFQAYGSFLVPVGRGLIVDFGKFGGALGYEGSYTKDQLNYSRAYFFNFLPFYHMGFRSTYSFNDRVSLTHWLVNGTQQTEDFNRFKSNALLLNVKTRPGVSWNVNYYFGQESREYVAMYSPELPAVPSQPGLPVDAVRPPPDGSLHVLDSYASWQVSSRLTVAGEADYVINRTTSNSAPSRVIGGAAYAAYRFRPSWMLAARFEYLDDRHGLFSGASQALKENTLTLTYEPKPGFQLRTEWCRDYSNRRFFLSDEPGLLRARQDTATLGILWWFGKEGTW